MIAIRVKHSSDIQGRQMLDMVGTSASEDRANLPDKDNTGKGINTNGQEIELPKVMYGSVIYYADNTVSVYTPGGWS